MTMMVFEEATYDYCEFLDKKGIDVTKFVTKAEAAVFHELAGDECVQTPDLDCILDPLSSSCSEADEQAWDIIRREVSEFENGTPYFKNDVKGKFDAWNEGTCPYFDEDFHGVCAEGVPEMICKGKRCRTDADCGPSTISGQVVCYTGSDDQAGYYWDWGCN